MKQTIRKTSIVLGCVSYSDGDFTKNLSASNISIEVTDNRLVLSLDLSSNQTRGSEGSNSYLDAQLLKTKFARLKEVRLNRDKWLDDGLRDAL